MVSTELVKALVELVLVSRLVALVTDEVAI